MPSDPSQSTKLNESIDRMQEASGATDALIEYQTFIRQRVVAISEHRNRGEVDEAIDAASDLVVHCDQTLGTHHPQTLACASDLAHILWETGFSQDALWLQSGILDLQKKVLGWDHPETLRSLSRLSDIFYSLDDPESAYRTWWLFITKATIINPEGTFALIPFKENEGNWRKWPQPVLNMTYTHNVDSFMAGLLRLEIFADYCNFHGRNDEAESLMLRSFYLRRTLLDGDHYNTERLENILVSMYKNAGRDKDLAAFRQRNLDQQMLGAWAVDQPLQIQLNAKDASLETVFKRKLGLPGTVNGRYCSALADTGSEHNIISYQLALEMNLAVWPTCCIFAMGNSRTIRSVGYAQIEWIFQQDMYTCKHVAIVHVLSTCVYDLIFGDEFLTKTKVLTTYPHFLQQCSFKSRKHKVSLSLLDSPKCRVTGFLQRSESHYAIPVRAVPDTGAEANFMSETWARSYGCKITPSKNFVQFADGSEEATMGHVDLLWSFDVDSTLTRKMLDPLYYWPGATAMQPPKPLKLRFQIIRKCQVDVVLGEDMLHSSDLFKRFPQNIVRVDSQSTTHDLLHFGFRRGKKPSPEQGAKFEALKPDFEDDSKELEQQAQWDERTRPTATPEEIQAEEERRAAYERRRAQNLNTTT